MIPSRGASRRIRFAFIVLAFMVSTSVADPSASDSEDCTISLACHRCTETDRLSLDACQITGKIQEYTCWTADENDAEEKTARYESCRRTQTDEEFLIVQLQVFCLTVGSLAFMSVRRHSFLSANLFDRRKVPGQQTVSAASAARNIPKLSRSNPGAIELMSSTRNEETASLTANNAMEIV